MAPQASSSFYAMRDKVICNALDKYPDLGTRTVARILFKDNPILFGTIENARACISYKRGLLGDTHRKILTDKRYVRQPL